MKRRLAAILSADVVEYSRLMSEDELGTFVALKARRLDLFEPKIADHHGRVVKTMGDGLLVEFASVIDAVECALALQEANLAADKDVALGRRIVVRIGVSLGDVLSDEDDIFGTGVNVAARLQSIAEPGGICVSGSVADQIRGKLPAVLRERGIHRLRNIAEPVAVYDVLRGSDSGSEGSGPATHLPLPGRPSIAVLPLDNLSGDPTQQYFSDGISEDLITELARFRPLFVVARNSSFRYRGGDVDVKKVGRELGVQYIVEGSIQRIADRLRTTVQLIDAGNGFHIWADRYDHRVDDLFAVQDEITHNISSRISNRLEQAQLDSAKRRPPTSLRAYDLWLRGIECQEIATEEGFATARRYFEEAIAADPGFARPYANLAEIAYMESVLSDWGRDAPEDWSQACDLAQKAVTLDRQDAQGHAVLGWVYLVQRQLPRARRHWQLAASLNPNDADITMWRATALAFMGDAEGGRAAAQTALRLNPFHPDWYLSDLAVVLFFCRRYDEMLDIYDVIPELYPHTPAWRAAALAHLGRDDEARDRAAAFARNIQPIWRGAPGAGPADYGRWFIDHIPLARPEDVAHLAEGLRRAGLLAESGKE